MNICAIRPDVTHVVAMSGFISVGAILAQNFSGPLSLFYHAIYDIEKNANPEYVRYQAQESLKGTDAKVLIIHSTDDKIVKAQNHYNILRYALTTKPNIRFLKRKKNLLPSDEEKALYAEGFDWHRMTAQDEKVWAEIFKTLDA